MIGELTEAIERFTSEAEGKRVAARRLIPNPKRLVISSVRDEPGFIREHSD
jgi:hypothetical protein